MPTSPPSRCTEPTCTTLTTTGRCPEHTHHRNRTGAWASGSTRAWRRARKRQLDEEPNCWCGRPAVEVDHIIPRSQGGAFFDPENLQSLCSTHHAEKTKRERAQALSAPRKPGGAPGAP